MKNDYTMENYLMAKKTIAETQKFVKNKKRNNFNNFCSGINRDTNMSKIWKTFNNFSTKKRHTSKNKAPENQTAQEVPNNLDINNIPAEFTLKRN